MTIIVVYPVTSYCLCSDIQYFKIWRIGWLRMRVHECSSRFVLQPTPRNLQLDAGKVDHNFKTCNQFRKENPTT